MSKLQLFINRVAPDINDSGTRLPKLNLKSIHSKEDRADSPRPTYTEVEFLEPEAALGGAGAPPKHRLFDFESPKPKFKTSAVFCGGDDLTESDDEAVPHRIFLEASAESDETDPHTPPAARKVSLSFLGESDENPLETSFEYSGTLSLGSLPSDEN